MHWNEKMNRKKRENKYWYEQEFGWSYKKGELIWEIHNEKPDKIGRRKENGQLPKYLKGRQKKIQDFNKKKR